MTRQSYKHNNAEYESYINVQTDTNMEDEIITAITDENYLRFIKSEIMFMSKIYRDVMVMFYFGGLQMNEIADKLNIPVNRVKQRLHSAKEKIKKEVNNMSNTNYALKPFKLSLPGSGNPLKSNVRDQLNTVIAQNIAYICKDKAKTPSEIALELSVPTVFVEDMLEKMTDEAMKKLDDGKYISNIIIIDNKDVKMISDTIKVVVKDYVTDIIKDLNDKKDEIMNWKCLSNPKSFEFILWSIIPNVDGGIGWKISNYANIHYKNVEIEKRDFKVVGIATDNDEVDFNMYGRNDNGNDTLHLCNFIGKRLPWGKTRFGCANNVHEHILFTFKCIGGLSKNDVAENEVESCAKALDLGYISLGDDGKYYPEILIWDKQYPEYNFSDVAAKHAEKLKDKFIEFIDKYVPAHLINNRDIFVDIMTTPLRHYIIEEAIEQGALYIPEGDTIIEGIYGIRK